MHRIIAALARRWWWGLLALLLTAGPLAPPLSVVAAPSLSLTPSTIDPGTPVQVRAAGLAPATTYLVQLVAGQGNVNTIRLSETTSRSDAAGQLSTTLTANQPAGRYAVRLVTVGGTIVALAPLTIRGSGPAGPPGLPRTGAGGSNHAAR